MTSCDRIALDNYPLSGSSAMALQHVLVNLLARYIIPAILTYSPTEVASG